MQKTKRTKRLLLLVCMVLIAAVALFASGCNTNNVTEPESQVSSTEQTSSAAATVLGQGATKFYFNVVDSSGNETAFEINTDKKYVGEALQELGLIDGDAGPYGLYVKTVNGITADYDTDSTYWAFYINGEMAPTGVDLTEITASETYSFIISK